MKSPEQLIEQLSSNLRPVKPPVSSVLLFGIWILSAVLIVGLEFLFSGGVRQNFYEQLMSSKQFMAETLIALGMVLSASYSVIVMGIPDDERTPMMKYSGVLALALFVGFLIIGLFNPALPPSEDHHRQLCALEVFFFGLVPGFILFRILRQRAPTQTRWTGALLGLASMGLPAAFMQISCKYQPDHILIGHVLPVFAMMILGAILGPKIFKW